MSGLMKTDVEGYAKSSTGAVINTDNSSYQQYINRRNVVLQKNNQVTELSSRVISLEDKLSNIEQMLQQLINKVE